MFEPQLTKEDSSPFFEDVRKGTKELKALTGGSLMPLERDLGEHSSHNTVKRAN